MADHLDEPSGRRATRGARAARGEDKGDGAGDGPGRRRAKGPRRHVVAKVILATVVVLGLVTGLAVVYLARHLSDNLTVLDIDDQVKNRPDKKGRDLPKEPLNILVMGSDDRDGTGNNIDGLTGGGARSDTTILFHLSADRKNAYGISIPRDTLVDRPDCTDEDGEKIPGASDVMWNEAFNLGGPACTIQQFEDLTDIYVDHFVVVDFNGFKDMVDAIDGVEVCIPEDIEDPEHGINLKAGTREIEGKEALNYVRVRSVGDGSDLGRIKRQQAFIAAMANKVLSTGVVARVDRLVGFLNAATKSLVVDEDMGNVFRIGRIGQSFRNIGLDNIQFITAPVADSVEQPGRVVLLPEVRRLWKRVIDDEPLSRRLADDVITAEDEGGADSGGTGPDRGDESTAAPDVTDEEEAAERERVGLCA